MQIYKHSDGSALVERTAQRMRALLTAAGEYCDLGGQCCSCNVAERRGRSVYLHTKQPARQIPGH